MQGNLLIVFKKAVLSFGRQDFTTSMFIDDKEEHKIYYCKEREKDGAIWGGGELIYDVTNSTLDKWIKDKNRLYIITFYTEKFLVKNK